MEFLLESLLFTYALFSSFSFKKRLFAVALRMGVLFIDSSASEDILLLRLEALLYFFAFELA